jgi:hypothetical protein
MAAPANIDPPPSPWTVISDFAKTVITLGSALLALSVTFSTNFIGKSTDSAQLKLLFVSWGLLLLTIALGVVTLGFVINYLRSGTRDSLAVFCANSSFYALLASAVAFGIFGKNTIGNYSVWDAATTVEKTLVDMPRITGKQGSQWLLVSLKWNEPSKVYELVVQESNTTEKFKVEIDTLKGRAVKAEKAP